MKWICSFKAYGDLVIACRVLRAVNSADYGLLAGSHLAALLSAIQYPGVFRLVECGKAVPSFFDMKKCGLWHGLLNGVLLKWRIFCARGQNGPLVFDRLGVKEKFLTFGVNAEQISRGQPNIYLDYLDYFGADPVLIVNPAPDNSVRTIAVFPDSRLVQKQIPDDHIEKIRSLAREKGLSVSIIRVGKPMHFADEPDVFWVDGFDALLDKIVNADSIVTADSLPGHIAEYVGKPTFVFTPVRNDYWMPFSCYVNGDFACFGDFSKYAAWLRKMVG